MKKEEKEQLEGEKRNEDNRQSEEKRREEETSSKEEVPHLERNSNFCIEHQQQARWGGYSSDQATLTPQRGSVPLLLFSAVK